MIIMKENNNKLGCSKAGYSKISNLIPCLSRKGSKKINKRR
jgi:hypothetical protein